MSLRTDRDRFTDLDYTCALLRTYLGVDIGPLSPEQRKLLNEEMRAFGEYWKGALDVITNLQMLGVNAYNTIEYYRIVQRTGGSKGAISQIFKYTLQLTKEGKLGATFIERIAANSSQISKALTNFKQSGSKFLGFLVCLQVAFHAARGDYAKCVAEVAKTALCGAIPLMAFMDLVDAILGLILPEWVLKQPVVRVLRGMNPAQCTFSMVENMCWLVYCGTIARQRGMTAFNAALDAWCIQMEKSPMAIYTNLSRDTAMLFDEYILPDCFSNFSIFGASIRNLADYARANPTAY